MTALDCGRDRADRAEVAVDDIAIDFATVIGWTWPADLA
jgi:hypothetical protein